MREICNFGCTFEIKAEDERTGVFTGVASTSDLDSQGDIVEPGAFEPIAKKRSPSGDLIPNVMMLRDHDASQIIGGWKSFRQDGHEFFVEGELMVDEVPKARETYALMRRGYLNGLSVGFEARGDAIEIRRGRRHIKRASLKEISIVGFPANRNARIINVKNQIEDWRDVMGIETADIDELLTLLKETTPEKPYGDVQYADPGYQEDEKKRYPLDTEAHIRNAWSRINTPANRTFYTREQLQKIEGRIIAAWKRVVDKDGPPSAQEDKNESKGERKSLILGIDGYTEITSAATTEAFGLLALLKGRGHVRR